MKKTVLLIIVMACGFMSTQAMAQKFPAYYPKSFQETGVIDAVNLGKGKIIIGDIAYQVSPQVVVRSRSSIEDSTARLRVGATVGFMVSGNRITEFWLLPDNYDRQRR